MCYCCQKLESWSISGADRERIGSGSGADLHVTCLSQSEAQNREGIRSGSGADWERIPSQSHVISLSQSEAQKVRVDPLPIRSRSAPNPLPTGSAPKSHVILTSCLVDARQCSRCSGKVRTNHVYTTYD